MRYKVKFQLFIFGVLLLNACKKETQLEPEATASLNVVNAVVNGGNVKLNTNVRDSANSYNAKSFAIVPNTNILLYPTNSPGSAYFNNNPGADNKGIYTVYLAGQDPTYESVFVKENLPERYMDSVIGVRIVNLSPNSQPVNVTLASAPSTNVFSNVAYKQVTDFLKFPLLASTSTNAVTFQIKNSVGTILATYSLPASVNSTYPGISITLQRFKNITLVVRGLQGTTTGNNMFAVFPAVTTY